tara:strand:- start:1207 stop:3333 length:2127 start_codon:yes stop_codon:yes gene_type:complete
MTSPYDYDIVILNVPWSDLSVPFSAPAVLKGIAESHGYKAKTIDFNVDLYTNFCDQEDEKYTQVQEYYMTYTKDKPKIINEFYDYIIATLKKYKFRYLGISVFYILSQKATYELCNRVREDMPETKIVLGGKGLGVYNHLSLGPYLSEDEKKLRFDRLMAEKDLSDFFILGDAEDAIIDLLSGKLDDTAGEISNWFVPQKDNLEYPFANFDDYKLDQYIEKNEQVQIPIISSKGCVRRCDFCDVPSQFKKFQSKNGKRMAEEMLHLADKYNIQKFTMADSIANGNLKALIEFAGIIAKHNRHSPEHKKIKWSSNWIHRPVGQLTEAAFKLIAESGAEHFTVGAEHFSDNVLKSMGKKTNMAGLMHELALFQKYGVQCSINQIIGHWSERYDDFMEHIDHLIKLGPYFTNDTITFIKAHLFYIMSNTPAAMNSEKTGLEMLDDDFSLAWYTAKNPNLTLKPRLARYYFMIVLARYLKYPLDQRSFQIKNHIHRLQESLPRAMKLFNSKVNQNQFEPCKIFANIENIEAYAESKLQEFFQDTTVKLKFKSNSYRGDPVLFVNINGKQALEKSFTQGTHEITLDMKYDYVYNNKIEIGMKGKNKKYDTMVDKEGNIMQDKNIELEAIEIDSVNVLDYPQYFNENAKFIVDGKPTEPKYGFWHNGSTTLEFEAPFWRHLQGKKTLENYALKDKYDFEQNLNQFKNFFTRIEY